MKKFGCKADESLEIYPECFTYFCNNIMVGNLTPPLKASLSTYLCSIGWRILLKKFPQYRAKKNRPKNTLMLTSLEEIKWGEIHAAVEVYDRIDWEAKANLVQQLLQQLDKRCQEVLKMRYWEETSYEEVKERLGFSTKGAARKGNFDCIRKIQKLLKDKGIDLRQYL